MGIGRLVAGQNKPLVFPLSPEGFLIFSCPTMALMRLSIASSALQDGRVGYRATYGR